MTERWLERTVAELKRKVPVSADFDRRVLEAVALPRPRGTWLVGVAALAAAALIAVLVRSPARGGIGVEFTIDVPAATSVALVGDFNDWDRRRTPLVRVDGTTRWRARLPLAGGFYRYAYLVDGDRWIADPAQPGSPDPDFGTAVSLVSVK